MNKYQFIVEEADERVIRVRDLSTGGQFSFVIIDRKFDGVVGEHEPDPLDSTLRNQARSFALHEAGTRGLID